MPRSRLSARLFASVVVAVLLVAGVPQSATAQDGAPISANEAWLTDLYQDVLGRPGDDGGLDFWLGRIAGGGPLARERVARAFVYSTEGSRIEVDRAYADLLDRGAEAEGRAYWTTFLETNPVTDLRMLLVASEEYYLRYGGGTDRGWITATYREVLGRDPEPAGLDYWLGEVDRGAPPVYVVHSIYISEESLRRRAVAYGQELLDRSLTEAEVADGVALIRADDERAWRARLWASDERFGSYLEGVGLLTTGGVSS